MDVVWAVAGSRNCTKEKPICISIRLPAKATASRTQDTTVPSRMPMASSEAMNPIRAGSPVGTAAGTGITGRSTVASKTPTAALSCRGICSEPRMGKTANRPVSRVSTSTHSTALAPVKAQTLEFNKVGVMSASVELPHDGVEVREHFGREPGHHLHHPGEADGHRQQHRDDLGHEGDGLILEAGHHLEQRDQQAHRQRYHQGRPRHEERSAKGILPNLRDQKLIHPVYPFTGET